jgi:hypothetical protein
LVEEAQRATATIARGVFIVSIEKLIFCEISWRAHRPTLMRWEKKEDKIELG